VHREQDSTICAANAAHARPDLLPDEPGGYIRDQARFGSLYTVPAITGGQQTSRATWRAHPSSIRMSPRAPQGQESSSFLKKRTKKLLFPSRTLPERTATAT
jgi:hypothetical protein